MKYAQSKTNPIKTGRELGTMYHLECKDFTHNFRLQEVKTTNKVLGEKSNCIVCRSNKSRFLKQKMVDYLRSQNVPTVELKSQDL